MATRFSHIEQRKGEQVAVLELTPGRFEAFRRDALLLRISNLKRLNQDLTAEAFALADLLLAEKE